MYHHFPLEESLRIMRELRGSLSHREIHAEVIKVQPGYPFKSLSRYMTKHMPLSKKEIEVLFRKHHANGTFGAFKVKKNEEIGTIRLRKNTHKNANRVYYQKTEKGWRKLDIILWEKAYGPFDIFTYQLVYKDGNTLNCTIENLILEKKKILKEAGQLTNERLAGKMAKGDKSLKDVYLQYPDILDYERERIAFNKINENLKYEQRIKRRNAKGSH